MNLKLGGECKKSTGAMYHAKGQHTAQNAARHFKTAYGGDWKSLLFRYIQVEESNFIHAEWVLINETNRTIEDSGVKVLGIPNYVCTRIIGPLWPAPNIPLLPYHSNLCHLSEDKRFLGDIFSIGVLIGW